jgi:hypothetical protein
MGPADGDRMDSRGMGCRAGGVCMAGRTVTAKPCVDCVAQGITTKRKTPYPGPRCASHNRAKRRSRKDYSHTAHVLATYGLPIEDYWKVHAFQGGVCAICRRATGEKRKLAVDHDHKTGLYRGNLCRFCNRNILGFARDDIEFFERAIAYLRNPPAVAALGGPHYVPEQ